MKKIKNQYSRFAASMTKKKEKVEHFDIGELFLHFGSHWHDAVLFIKQHMAIFVF